MTLQRSGSIFPLLTGTGRSMLQDADPAVFWLLDYFEAILRINLDARIHELAIARVTTSVSATVPFDPVPFLQQTQFKFPLLALYRTQSRFDDRTVAKRRERATLDLLYVLPPLTAAQAEKLVPLLHAAATVLDFAVSARRDPGYQPAGGAMGESPFDSGFANLEGAEFTDASFGLVTGIDDLVFYALKLTAAITEIDILDDAALPDLETVDNVVVVQPAIDPSADDFIVDDLTDTT